MIKALFLLVLATPAWGNEPVDPYWQFFAGSNRYPVMETAGAHGISGIRVAGGISSSLVPKAARTPLADELGRRPGENLVSPRVWVTKGLIYPFDVGLGVSRFGGTRANQWGGYVQWTLFEALGTPAVATRLSHSRVTGLERTRFNTTSAELVASWGVWIMSGYIGVSRDRHRGEASPKDAGSDFALMFAKNEEPKYDAWTTTNWVGAEFQLLPPFVKAGLELGRMSTGLTTFSARVSVGW